MVYMKTFPKMYVASSTYNIDIVSDSLIDDITEKFYQDFKEAGGFKTDPPMFFTVFHVTEYKDEGYTMELWECVEKMKEDTKDIQFKEIPESEVVYLNTSENYNNLTGCYNKLFNYITQNHLILNGYPRETYIADDTAESGYITEIQIPFRRNI